MALYISTGDGVEKYRTVDLYRGRTSMVLSIATGDGVVGYGAVDLYWGRCGRVCRCRSLLGTLW